MTRPLPAACQKAPPASLFSPFTTLHACTGSYMIPPPIFSLTKTAPLPYAPPVPNPDYFHVINIQRAITKSFATKTLQNYSSAIRSFLAWCDTHRIHEDICFPASKYILCAYIASLAGSKSKSSLNSVLAGLKAWHNASGRPWNDSPRLSMVVHGATADAPASSTRPLRKPVTTKMLTILVRGLNTNSPFDAATATTALVAFWGQCRLGELVGTAKLKHDPKKTPSRNSLSLAISHDSSCELTLPSTKTHHTAGETVVLTAQSDPICPISALCHLLALTPDIPNTAHLFAHPARNRPNTMHLLTKESFLSQVNEIWRAAGFPPASGHTCRLGGTTCLLRAGIAPEVVRSMGRWSSDTHFRYWRDTAALAINHAENLSTTRTQNRCNTSPRPCEAPSRRTRRPAPPRGRPY